MYRNPRVFLDRGIEFSPESVIAYNNYAEILLDSNKYSQAIDYYEKSFEYEKDEQTSGKIADIYNRYLNNPNEAIKWFEITFNLDTVSIPAAGSIGDCYLMQLHDTADAIIWYNKALKIDPASAPILCAQGIVYINKGDFIEGRALLTKCLTNDENRLQAFIWISISYYKEGKINEAINYLTKAYADYPNNTELQRNLMICYYKINDYKGTEEFESLCAKNNVPIPAEIVSYLKSK